MPLFDGTVASTGLSKQLNMSGFLSKQTLPYNSPYFAFDPRRKDGAEFTPPWSSSKTALLDGRSPVSQLSGTEGQNHIIYRQDSNSSDDGQSHSSTMRHTPVTQGFTRYTKSPGISSPTTATSVAGKKTKNGGVSSPSSENSVFLAIPKPVYGHNPCCHELGCVLGQRYGMENGPSTEYDQNWMQTDAYYSKRLPIQRKPQDPLLQRRGLQFEPSAEQLKRAEIYSPSRARTLPAGIEPNYSSYPCTPTHTAFGSLSEQSQHIHTSPRGYPSLYPSHPTYEHMTSEVYQERSPMSKYGQLTQHPMFYYPQANAEVENRTRCKDISGKQREDVPVIVKHIISNPRDHYKIPPILHAEMPVHLPSSDTLSNHSLMQGLNYPCYAVPGLHLNPMRAPLKRQLAPPGFRSNCLDVSPSEQLIDLSMTSAAILHKNKPGLHVDQSHTSSPFRRVERISPTQCVSQPVSPSSIQRNRFFPPLPSLHPDQPIPPPSSLTVERLLDSTSCEAQVMCPKQTKDHPGAWLPPSPNRSSDCTTVRTIVYSPALATGNKHSSPTSSSATTASKGRLKRSISHLSPPIKVEDEDRDLCVVDLNKKRQKLEMESVQVRHDADSPPMPVIDNVFSLAPYQAYLQASGVLFPGVVPKGRVASEPIKPKLCVKEKRLVGDKHQPVVSKDVFPDTPTEKPVVELLEPKNIKLEKVGPTDKKNTVDSSATVTDCSKMSIKKEPEDTGFSGRGPVTVRKSEPNEHERTSLSADDKRTSSESKPAESIAKVDSQSLDDESTPQQQVVSFKYKPITPPQLPEAQHNFQNLPPQCLKLPTYKIMVPDTQQSSPVPPQENPLTRLMTDFTPHSELKIPARKHFFELHRSLCKLVSQSVSTSSEQELRTWLSQLELGDPASPLNKVKKVSCLLGPKAREKWLKEEVKIALQEILERLREYTAQERCPFPHVMRRGAVFLPMLVVKEQLFPMVQGSYVDQVLQEHRVELRPTTLSEEKILIQLHKRACSSRLRRLMSLKHLPDIYADVLNLSYYTYVCKHLGLANCANREQADDCEETSRRSRSCAPSGIIVPPASPSGSQRHPKENETKSHSNSNRTKSRIKSSSRRMFLDSSWSDEEEADDVGKSRRVSKKLSKKNKSGLQSGKAENRGSDCLLAKQDSTPENSWTCPLTLDEISPSASDTEMEESSSHSAGPASFQLASKKCSGMILKLRRMFVEGVKRKKARYQAVSFSGTITEPAPSQTQDEEGGVSKERSSDKVLHRVTAKLTSRWQRTGSLSHVLRPLRSSTKRTQRSLLKIKYCPYLSACHSAEYRRRWVLRSAVQRARRAMRFHYPDLVGKRIRHLYEEDDKSEVWYRGEVMRVHEAHANPLKTIFEVRYDSEPEWKYYLELLIDYKKGWLKIED